MKKIFILIVCVFLYGSNVNSTKKELKNTSYKIAKMNKKLDSLASKIIKQQNSIQNLIKKQQSIESQINALQQQLKNSKSLLSELKNLSKGLEQKKENIKNEVIKFISQNYYLDTKNIDSLNDLIYSEFSKQVLKQYSKKLSTLVDQYKLIDQNLTATNNKIQEIIDKQKLLVQKENELNKLKKRKFKELRALKKQKDDYKKRLLSMMKKEQLLRKKLQELKIVKQREIPVTNNLNVKKVGSIYYKPKIATYKGQKTIPPVYGQVIKKFGSYIDPIYKIKIYNDSITIKTKPNSVVRSIMNGKVVYIGDSGDKKVVFIKHKGNLFSIYANLSKVSPLLKKGSYVKRGQIIARVDNSLEFEVTYKDRPINPLKVIRLR